MINITTIKEIGKYIHSTNNSLRNFKCENPPRNIWLWPYLKILEMKIALRSIKTNQKIKKLLKKIDDMYLLIGDPEDFTKVEKELREFLKKEVSMLGNLNSIIEQREEISNIDSPNLREELEKLYDNAEKWYDEIEDRAETLAISLNLGDKIQKIIEQIECAPKENLPLLSDVLTKL